MKTFSSELLSFQTELIFQKIGISEGNSQIASKVLITAELRGIPSHGIMRIPDYISLWEKGRINISPKINIVRESLSTGVIDGDNGYGVIVGPQAMEMVINKAKQSGSAWISVNNSNHFGIAGYYAMMALEHDMIGIAMTNANPLVAPTFSVSRFLGTNPIAVAIPAGKESPFVADFATTPIARGKLALMHKKGEKTPLGFVQDKEGNPSTDPNILTEGGAILPLGGDYEHGSHKGYCLGAIVDIFSSVLSGANFGPFVPPQVGYLPLKENLPGKGLGHFFGAMRIDSFQSADDFKSYMDLWISTFKASIPAKNHEKVFIPGEPERILEAKYKVEGIPVMDSILKDIEEVCLKVEADFILK